MSNVLIEESVMQNIANSIREKTGKSGLMLPAQMSDEIDGIETGGSGEIHVGTGLVTSYGSTIRFNFSEPTSYNISKFFIFSNLEGNLDSSHSVISSVKDEGNNDYKVYFRTGSSVSHDYPIVESSAYEGNLEVTVQGYDFNQFTEYIVVAYYE